MPAQVYRHSLLVCQEEAVCSQDTETLWKLTYLHIVFIRPRILHSISERNTVQELLSHLVQCRLRTHAIIFRERLEGCVPRLCKCLNEMRDIRLNVRNIFEVLPSPLNIHITAQNAVPRLRQCRVFIFDVSPELRPGAFQNTEAKNSRRDINARSFGNIHADLSFDAPILEE